MDTLCANVVVGAFVCQPMFEVTSDGLTISLVDASVTSTAVSQWIWSFGDNGAATGEPQVSHTYSDLGVYDVCLTIQADTCIATVCQTVDLSDVCLLTTAQFNVEVLQGSSVQFTDNSTGNITSRLWGFGDGTTSTEMNPVHEYGAPGNYVVCLLVLDALNNCSDFHCQEVNFQTTGTKEQPRSRSLTLFPNPLSSESSDLQIAGILQEDYGQTCTVGLYTMDGQLVDSFRENGGEVLTMQINSGLTPSMYFVQIRSPRNLYVGKLIVR